MDTSDRVTSQAPPDNGELAQARAFIVDLSQRIVDTRSAAQQAERRAKRAHKRGDSALANYELGQATTCRIELAQLQRLVYGLSRRFPDVLAN